MSKTTKKAVDPQVSAAAAALGSKGGSQGIGGVKRRDPSHYAVTLAEARRTKRLQRQMGNQE